MDNWRIRPLNLKELATVLEVERACYPNPWSRDLFVQEYDNPQARVDLLWVGTALAGYLVSWHVLDEVHILNVATAPVFRRQGVAAHLLEHVLSRARRKGMARALLEVRVGNAGAIALYESFGFKRDALRRRYYPDGEDALLMSFQEPEEHPGASPCGAGKTL